MGLGCSGRSPMNVFSARRDPKLGQHSLFSLCRLLVLISSCRSALRGVCVGWMCWELVVTYFVGYILWQWWALGPPQRQPGPSWVIRGDETSFIIICVATGIQASLQCEPCLATTVQIGLCGHPGALFSCKWTSFSKLLQPNLPYRCPHPPPPKKDPNKDSNPCVQTRWSWPQNGLSREAKAVFTMKTPLRVPWVARSWIPDGLRALKSSQGGNMSPQIIADFSHMSESCIDKIKQNLEALRLSRLKFENRDTSRRRKDGLFHAWSPDFQGIKSLTK